MNDITSKIRKYSLNEVINILSINKIPCTSFTDYYPANLSDDVSTQMAQDFLIWCIESGYVKVEDLNNAN